MAKLLLYLKAGIVQCRITVAPGDKTELSTGQKVPPEKWDADKKRMKGNSVTAESVNRRLEQITAKIRNIETELSGKGVRITAKTLRDFLEGKGSEQKGLLQVFSQYVEHLENQPPALRLAPGTIDRYRNRLHNTEEYLLTIGMRDLNLPDVDDDFLEGFKIHMLNVKKWKTGHTAKHLEAIKVVMRFAQQKKYTTVNFVAASKIERENYSDREFVFLSQQQLEDLERYTFHGNLQQVADCAVIQAHTGLAYRELLDMVPDWIQTSMDGSTWLVFKRKKTERKKKRSTRVLLDQTALALIVKYKQHPACLLSGRCLPVMSNGAYNRNLKIIAGLLGLPPALSSHHLRKTAGTLWITNGVPMETVAELLGDTVEVTKLHYIKILEEKIVRDMSAYDERMKNKKQL